MSVREMKDSGIEWVGQVPRNWDLKPIYTMFASVRNKNIDGSESNSLRFSYGTIVSKENFDPNDEYVNKTIRSYIKILPGDLVINGLNLNYDFVTKRVAISQNKGIITSAYIVMRLTDRCNCSNFYYYLFKSYENCGALHGMGEGVRKILSYEELKNHKILLPSVLEQTAIASYLDAKCEEIDSLTADIEKEIETLQEYKKSVITEAVTKGLDPNVEMKDCGVEWVGEIPKHWHVVPFNQLFYFDRGLQITKANLVDDGIPCLSYGDIHSKFNVFVNPEKDQLPFVSEDYLKCNKHSLLCDGDFIFADTSEDIVGSGNFSCVRDFKGEFFAGYHTVICRSRIHEALHSIYFAYLFQSLAYRSQIQRQVKGIKVFSITQRILKTTKVWFPKLNEQTAIANFLDTKCEEIDDIVDKKQKQLETLAQYKQSIIYEYVTGKKSVPMD